MVHFHPTHKTAAAAVSAVFSTVVIIFIVIIILVIINIIVAASAIAIAIAIIPIATAASLTYTTLFANIISFTISNGIIVILQYINGV